MVVWPFCRRLKMEIIDGRTDGLSQLSIDRPPSCPKGTKIDEGDWKQAPMFQGFWTGGANRN